MNYTEKYRDPQTVKRLIGDIWKHKDSGRNYCIMEVCGTHTVAVYRYGIGSLLPENIQLMSGPGCPVCVTPISYVDHAIALARRDDVILSTFGDFMRVPGSTTSLEGVRAGGADVRVLYSPVEAIKLAEKISAKKVVFLGLGFETTAPTVASTVQNAYKKGIENFYVLSGNKVMPPPMKALVSSGESLVDGFICPGHVSAIIGAEPYRFLADEWGAANVITGFEPVDIVQAILMLVRQIDSGKPDVEIQYRRVVNPEGNPRALAIIDEVFEIADDTWRGFGVIPGSGLVFREKYASFDAVSQLSVEIEPAKEPAGCICGDILRGRSTPFDCELFGKFCTPESPVGACMVSSEGNCAAAYKYGERA